MKALAVYMLVFSSGGLLASLISEGLNRSAKEELRTQVEDLTDAGAKCTSDKEAGLRYFNSCLEHLEDEARQSETCIRQLMSCQRWDCKGKK